MGLAETPIVNALRVARTQQKAIGFATTVASLAFISWITLKPLAGPLTDRFQLCVLCGTYGGA
jgi:hypothetical protein